MKIVDIFAGCGGFSSGFRSAGFGHSRLVEWESRCCETLERNSFENIVCDDIKNVDFRNLRGKVDILIGSPPCQPFSIGGRLQGAEDERNGWDEAVRATSEIRPKAICFENVSSMLTEKFRPYVQKLERKFKRLGYSITFYNINCADYGVPQFRKRCFCIAFHKDLGNVTFTFPNPQPHITVRGALTEMPNIGSNRHDLHRTIPRQYKGHTGSVLDKPSKTIVCAKNGCGGGMNCITLDDGTFRRYTIREAARIMTFPDTYQFHPTWSRAFSEIGNAVPPNVALQIAEELKKALQNR